MKKIIYILIFILVNITPSFGENYLVVGEIYNNRSDAQNFAAKCRLKNYSAQVFRSCDYSGLNPGKYGVAFGSYENSQKAVTEGKKLLKHGFNIKIIPAGKYIGVVATGKVTTRKSNYIIVLNIFQSKKEAIKKTTQYHKKNLFPIMINGKFYENLEKDSYYLVLLVTESKIRAVSYVREVFYDFENLQILRTGFYKGRKKNKLINSSGLWEKTLEFRGKFKEAESLLTMGETTLAIDAYEECLKLFYFHEESRLKIIKLLIRFEKWKEALHNIKIVEETFQNQELSYLKYYCKIKIDKENKKFLYKKFKRMFPNSPYLKELKNLL